MSFAVYPSSVNALQGVVSNALFSTRSEFSVNSQNTIGYQTLLFTKEIDLDFSTSGTQTIRVGELPLNCMIFSSVCYSSGLIGLDPAGNTLVSGDSVNTSLNMSVQGQSNGATTVVTLNQSLQYPNMVSGEFNPSSPTNPFISVLRDDPESPKNLQLVFNWSGTSTLANLKGTIMVKVSLQQMDPNNVTTDGYPTGGQSSGPVEGSLVFPIV